MLFVDKACEDENSSLVSDFNFFFLQDTMDQLKRLQKMDGITIICPKLMMDSAKIPPQIFVEGRPKRQRPTHAGKLCNYKYLIVLIYVNPQ